MWLDLDREKAVQYALLTKHVCSGCGTRDEEWFDGTTNEHGERREAEPPPYVAQGYRCIGCRELDRTQRELKEGFADYPGGSDGVRTRLTRNPMMSVPSTAEGAE